MRIRHHATFIAFCIINIPTIYSQGVGINETGDAPDNSAMLDVSSTDKGFLTPRMTSAQRAAISSPAAGLLVFDTTTNTYWFFNGSSWLQLSTGSAPAASGPPEGTVISFMGSAAPTGYLICDGSAISRTTYAALFTVLGTTYGAGDGSTTFNLPDLRGYFLRGSDLGSGNDPDAASRTDRGDGTTGDNVGTKQNDNFAQHLHTVNPPATNTTTTGNHTHSVNPPATNTNTTGSHAHSVNPPATNTTTTGSHTHAVDPPSTNTSNGGNHTHAVDPPSTNSTSNGGHFHSVNPPATTTSTNGNHNHRQGSESLYRNFGGGTYIGNRTYLNGPHPSYQRQNTSTNGNHNHTVDIGSFNSGSVGNHSHFVNISSFNSASGGNHNHSLNIGSFSSASGGNHNHSVNIGTFNSGSTGNHNHSVDISSFNSASGGSHNHSVNISTFNSGNTGNNETRSKNISVLYCIKY